MRRDALSAMLGMCDGILSPAARATSAGDVSMYRAAFVLELCATNEWRAAILDQQRGQRLLAALVHLVQQVVAAPTGPDFDRRLRVLQQCWLYYRHAYLPTDGRLMSLATTPASTTPTALDGTALEETVRVFGMVVPVLGVLVESGMEVVARDMLGQLSGYVRQFSRPGQLRVTVEPSGWASAARSMVEVAVTLVCGHPRELYCHETWDLLKVLELRRFFTTDEVTQLVGSLVAVLQGSVRDAGAFDLGAVDGLVSLGSDISAEMVDECGLRAVGPLASLLAEAATNVTYAITKPHHRLIEVAVKMVARALGQVPAGISLSRADCPQIVVKDGAETVTVDVTHFACPVLLALVESWGPVPWVFLQDLTRLVCVRAVQCLVHEPDTALVQYCADQLVTWLWDTAAHFSRRFVRPAERRRIVQSLIHVCDAVVDVVPAVGPRVTEALELLVATGPPDLTAEDLQTVRVMRLTVNRWSPLRAAWAGTVARAVFGRAARAASAAGASGRARGFSGRRNVRAKISATWQ